MEDGARNWEEMEKDCLVVIFSKLGIEDLTVSVPFVCHSWYAATRDPLSWKILGFISCNFMPWGSLAKRFAAQYQVSRVSFSSFFKLAVCSSGGLATELRFPDTASMEDLILASKECPRLRILALPRLTMEDEERIPRLMAKWKELERLEIHSKPSNFVHLAAEIAQNCRYIHELVMPGSSIKKEDAQAIVNFLPKLKSLDLSRSYLRKEELLTIAEGCRELERLIAKNCIGFELDEEITRKASRITLFQHDGSKTKDDVTFELDECDEQYVTVI
ncbi:hypothetical protein HPP92_018673 [Vanilla planifolia]|uniref:F-box/LRR-repeat protein n=1 Tax=Vanilla planifolia TaxID=51239 RepID=A0A835UMM0_VANPL|nr:hypothetical protein HPP92_018673 [Vanilla planifolia]